LSWKPTGSDWKEKEMMKKNLLFLLTVTMPLTLLGQYWGERVTEKSFESSELYFTSYFLNNYGINNFRQVAVGFIQDPFLDLYLNPANLPSLNRRNLLYLDFRGDRTEPSVMTDYRTYPAYYETGVYDYYAPYYIDPRWYQDTRHEPEPVFSLGVLTFPFNGSLKNIFLGATYQLIYKQEPFYAMPSWIYYNKYGYDAFGGRMMEGNYIPVQDRYVGEDELLNNGQLFSAFLGNQFSEKLSAGIALNGVIHSRNGSYINNMSDEYGNTYDDNWYSNSEMKREQEYQHLDLAAGLKYQFSPTLLLGTKAGYLDGNADQTFNSRYSSYYDYQSSDVPGDYSTYYNESSTSQSWKHDGKNVYGSINLTKELKEKNTINAYYRYTRSEVDLDNQSTIQDTAYSASHWTYDSIFYEYYHHSSLSDQRQGSGTREDNTHEAMLNFRMKLTEKSSITFGGYFSRTESDISSFEPVVATRYSSYSSNDYPGDTLSLYEDKDLDWNYHALEWSLQIPLFFDFQVSPQWLISVGLNKVLKSWQIEDETIAYCRVRQRVENDSVKTDSNFAERYKEPTHKITEEFTDIIGKFVVQITPQIRIHLLVDPEFEDEFRIAQWWLGFQANL
jgi:hypothetical protein